MRVRTSVATCGTVVLAGGAATAVLAVRSGPVRAAVRFLEYYAGVVNLVALTLTVLVGLLATDRFLPPRHRVVLQGAHRVLATVSVLLLALHVLTKVAERHAAAIDGVVPFLAGHRTFYVGLGTIAGYLVLTAAVTGVARGRFAHSARPWLWRVLHGAAYLAWPVALLHGLQAGRPARPWVTASYLACLVVAAVVLATRARRGRQRRRRAAAVHPNRRTRRDRWPQPAPSRVAGPATVDRPSHRHGGPRRSWLGDDHDRPRLRGEVVR